MVTDGEVAGRVGDVCPNGDEWTFALYDQMKREICALVFHSEREARQAVKMMQDIVARAAAETLYEDVALAGRFASALQLLYEFEWS